MTKKMILTAFGKDRPGIVADVTEIIFRYGCNIEDSTMTRLDDEFALILLLTGQGDDLEENLSKECRRLDIEKGLSAFIRPVMSKKVKPVAGKLRKIRVEGLDQAGIVYTISKYLANNHANIEHLNSKRIFSPESGAAVYEMEIEILIPDTVSEGEFERGLDQIANQLHVEISLK